jgi:hypothetical protein
MAMILFPQEAQREAFDRLRSHPALSEREFELFIPEITTYEQIGGASNHLGSG